MEIVEAPLSQRNTIPIEKGTMINCVHALLVRARKILSPEDSVLR